jgi:hypothetical protein
MCLFVDMALHMTQGGSTTFTALKAQILAAICAKKKISAVCNRENLSSLMGYIAAMGQYRAKPEDQTYSGQCHATDEQKYNNSGHGAWECHNLLFHPTMGWCLCNTFSNNVCGINPAKQSLCLFAVTYPIVYQAMADSLKISLNVL